jgi:hypothetical protein
LDGLVFIIVYYRVEVIGLSVDNTSVKATKTFSNILCINQITFITEYYLWKVKLVSKGAVEMLFLHSKNKMCDV